MKQYCFICLPCVHQITVCSNWEVWRALNWGAAVTLSPAMRNAFTSFVTFKLPMGFKSEPKQQFLCHKNHYCWCTGRYRIGHQGWINYVFKILVCEVWNTLTLKKIVWGLRKMNVFLSETEYLLSENCDFNKMKFLYFMEIYKNCNWVLIKNSCCVSVKVFYWQKINISQCGCLW